MRSTWSGAGKATELLFIDAICDHLTHIFEIKRLLTNEWLERMKNAIFWIGQGKTIPSELEEAFRQAVVKHEQEHNKGQPFKQRTQGTAVNKGKRDEKVKLHPVVVEHLRKVVSFDPHVLPWNHNRRTLHACLMRLQEAAGIHLPCSEDHEHIRYCYVYGFHDLRRAFATMNADKLTPDALQALMRHKSYQTTQVYINMARQMDAAVAGLHVPEVLKAGAG
jgi:integrase